MTEKLEPLAPGLHHDVDERRYRMRGSGIAQSDIKLFNICAKEYRYVRDNPKPQSEAQLLGSVVDCILTEEFHYGDRFHVVPDCNRATTAGKLLWYRTQLDARGCDITEAMAILENVERRIEGKVKGSKFPESEEKIIKDLIETWPPRRGVTLIPQALADKARWMADAVREDREAKHYVAAVLGSQVAAVADIEGYRRKALIDWVLPEQLVDLKTCAKGMAHPDRYGGEIAKYGYHIQAAQYLDCWNSAIVGEVGAPLLDDWQFTHLVVESAEPWHVAVHRLDKKDVKQGRRVIDRVLPEFDAAERADYWPGYETRFTTRIPPYTRDAEWGGGDDE